MQLLWALLPMLILCANGYAEDESQDFDRACSELKQTAQDNSRTVSVGRVSRTTYYITPLFTQWTSRERQACRLQGACITDLPGQQAYIFDYQLNSRPLEDVRCPFGLGNRGNCKLPCQTLAADQSIYPFGSLIYIPALDGATCPQSGEAMNGCFYVGDTGGNIRGRGRFDLYLGDCEDYNANYSSCQDNYGGRFDLSSGHPFFWVNPSHPVAEMTRDYINNTL